jgi:hypothetical protein
MEDKKNMEDELARLRAMAEKLEGDLEEKEAVDLLEKAVEEAENFTRGLEEKGS